MSEMQGVDNPEIEEAPSNITTEESSQDAVGDSIFGSTNGFFEDLDREVNGAIQDGQEDSPQITQSIEEDVTPEVDSSEEKIDWEKRYKDSSREALRLKEQSDELTPFKPFVDALKNDEGLVSTIREYLEEGNKPKSISEELQLGDDFEFNIDDAVANPKSDSAKVFSGMIDRVVEGRVNQQLAQDKQQRNDEIASQAREKEASAFKQKMNMKDSDFNELMDFAKNHKMSYEDIYYLKNKDRVANNVAKNTKSDMLNQMKAVRNIPTSASSTNSQSRTTDVNEQIFESLKNLDNGVDSLFS